MSIDLPRYPRERMSLRSAPRDECAVSGTKSAIVAPMSGRGHFATRNRGIIDVADRCKGTFHSNTELDIDNARLRRAIHEYVLSIECNRVALRCSIDLIEKRSESRRDLVRLHACTNGRDWARLNTLHRNRIGHGRVFTSEISASACGW